ncbi:DUF4886 domain-containing protein [Lachnospiraceae bacterium 45-W7]
MNKTISKTKFFRIMLCFFLLPALLLGGCSAPATPEKTPASNEQTDSTPPDTQSQERDSQEQDSSDRQDSSSDGDNFDFNQSLALKAPEPAAGETPRILFVGNSHTFTNSLPDMFSELAAAMNHPCDVQELSEGYYTLTQFADTEDELGAILNQKLTDETWDFVILQENTNDSVTSAQETMLPAAKTLDEKIRAAGGQTGLLMTWSPKEGAGILSLTDVQTILSQNLIDVSEEIGSLLIPGGIAFMRCLEQYPQIELWDEDGMHPSLEGTYLAACTAYAVLFQESPEGCAYTADLDSGTATQLQTVAAGFLTK